MNAARRSQPAPGFAAKAPFSYRQDGAVPAFADDRPLIVYDGVCILCSGAMRDIARRDAAGQIRFTSAQSRLGQALFRHYGLDPVEFETVLLIADGRAYGKLDMARRVAAMIGGPWRLFALFGILPVAAQDWCYDLVARNRYRIFGRTETCMVPDASWRARVIDRENGV